MGLIVKQLHGVVFRHYAPHDTTLKQLEREAREAKHGLWADPDSLAPWEWRKR
jgi:micrococcal nuclease